MKMSNLLLSGVLFISLVAHGEDWSLWRQKAEAGNAEAQCVMGRIYSVGNGVPQSFAESAKWFRLSASQGNAEAQNRLGMCYVVGTGVDQNLQQAKKWFLLAAQQGDSNAQGLLGSIYADEGDLVEAYAWLLIACGSGNPDAPELRAECLKCMTPAQLKEGAKLAAQHKWKITKSKLVK